MGPKEIARLLDEDHCTACGGWDKEQGGSGHKGMCPAGAKGSRIASVLTIITTFENHIDADYGDIIDLVKYAHEADHVRVIEFESASYGELIVVWDGPDVSDDYLRKAVEADWN